MPGFYGDDDYDVAGSSCVVDAKNPIDGKAVREGDILLGLPSAGLHTNGYSLARRVLFDQLATTTSSIIPRSARPERPPAPHRLPSRCSRRAAPSTPWPTSPAAG
jgi:phosphoribosylformylglycinamidine cyclo-ligase